MELDYHAALTNSLGEATPLKKSRKTPASDHAAVAAFRMQLLHARISKAAAEMIEEDSFSRLTLDALATRAACSKTSIYKLFKSRSRLLVVIFEQRVRSLRDALNSALPLRDALIAYVKRNIEITHSDQHIAVMRGVFAELKSTPAIGKDIYAAGPGAAIEDLAAFIRQHGPKNGLKIDDPRRAAGQLLGSFHWAMQYEQLLGVRTAPSKMEVKREAESVVDRFLYGYRQSCGAASGDPVAAEQKWRAPGTT